MNSPVMKGAPIICRRASDPLQPGSWRGYFCRSCGREVQVSPTGRTQLDAGGVPYCNPCGARIIEKHLRGGATAKVAANPAAIRTVAERCECDFCGAVTDHSWAWRTRGFGVRCRGGARPLVSPLGLWAACENCAPLVSSRELEALAARVSIVLGAPRFMLEDLYRTLFACIFAGPIEWRKGEPKPAIEPEPD